MYTCSADSSSPAWCQLTHKTELTNTTKFPRPSDFYQTGELKMNKRPANPLFAGGGGGGFSLADSFGVTASLPVTSNAEEDSFVGGGAAGPAAAV